MRRLRGRGRFLASIFATAAVLSVGGAAYPQAVAADRAATSGAQRLAATPVAHDEAKLRELGIYRYESERLTLYSDIDPAVARTLPPIIDAVYPAWADYFGPLPPAEDGSAFRLTGYVIKDRGLFLDLGLLPEELVEFQHGKHRGYRFWMAEQDFDYYRRHLLIHEATHCFMTCIPERVRPPLFYQEGMAELFGAHAVTADGPIRFRTMPDDPLKQVGFGRIEIMRQAAAEGRGRSLESVLGLSAEDFTSRSEPYAWSWAACKFLDTHPRYCDRFRQLAALTNGTEFRNSLATLFADDRAALNVEWELFVGSLSYGYDIERAAIEWPAELRSLNAGESFALDVRADRGWQSSGVRVEAGREYTVTASGEVTLADDPKPWTSQPQGITIQYAEGRPLGRLLAIVLPVVRESSTELASPPGAVTEMGLSGTIRVTQPGVLYLRVNDRWSALADNRGAYQVTLARAASEAGTAAN